ncbi:GLPGLI family protein [Parapedobacter luteus]|uniref:GLPGLI family protein n=1 Tax=Parapedobacter luteus TaxID=623280 RepID=A0A1T5F9D6_9SPHI|nr:GLPGLI family protein [Parapedobacter luteus]SKB92782.1 GLPGLI family protein [Parapedobacter luteus]
MPGRKNKATLITLNSLLLLFCVEARQGDEGYKIYYEMTFRKDSTNSATTSELTELLISGDKSLFRTVAQGEKDTNEFHKHLEIRPYIHTNARYRIIKDRADEMVYYYEQIELLGGPICTYTELQNDMDWILMRDTLTISNLPCQKALLDYGNRSWEAWFCPDIPLSNGPYKFQGLPGLIIRMRDKTGSWVFDLKGIERVPSFTFDLAFLNDAEAMDKLEFYERKLHYKDNRMQINEAAGKISFPDEGTRQRLYEKAKIEAAKNNNWIELYP